MRSNNSVTTPWLLRLIVLSCLVSALAILFLATRNDTTLLGDPYYEDQILAPQRALIPWLLTLFVLLLAAVLGIVERLKK